jgi:hypothetical protein
MLSSISPLHHTHNNNNNTTQQHNIDACTPQWNDIKIALKAKTESDPIKATEMLETTHYKQNLGSDLKSSPTAGVIWDLKDPPGWDEV